MSLINDALKRASEAEKRRAGIRPGARRGPKGPEALGPPIEPVKKPTPSLLSRPDFWSAMFTFVLVAVSCAFFYSWWKSRPKKFVLHVPPGKDRLEMMIKQKPKKKEPEETGPLVVGDDGKVAGMENAAATNLVTTNSIALTNAPPAATNAMAVRPTNNIVSPTEHTNTIVNVGPDVDPRTGPLKPKATDTNAPTLLKPVALPATTTPDGTNGEIVTTPGPDKMKGGEEPVTKPKKEKPFPEIALKGIVLMKTNAVAFVNGRTIRVGEHVNGAELVEIGVDYVKLDHEGQVRQFFIAQ